MDTFDVGLAAHCVQRVVARSDWGGPEPLDVEQLLFGRPTGRDCRHVLVFDSSGATRTTGTSRTLVLRECSPDEVRSVPPLLWAAGTPAVVQSVVGRSDAPPLLILSRDALAAMLLESDSEEHLP